MTELFGQTGSHIPSLDGATEWLNSEPLIPAGLRGNVVLVNFWTLTCINWLRQEPYVRAWSQAYRSDGLVVIGTPRRSSRSSTRSTSSGGRRRSEESTTGRGRQRLRDLERLRQPLLAGALLRRRGRRHPRPALRRRTLRAIGARHPAAARRRARACLGRRGRRGGGGRLGPPGYARDLSRLRPQRRLRRLGPGRRVGDWARGRRARSGRREHRLPVPRTRRESGAVAGSARADSFRVLLDGEAPGKSHGVDVDKDGNGLLADGRLYQLAREHDKVRERTLEITFLEPGAEAYVFTFG